MNPQGIHLKFKTNSQLKKVFIDDNNNKKSKTNNSAICSTFSSQRNLFKFDFKLCEENNY